MHYNGRKTGFYPSPISPYKSMGHRALCSGFLNFQCLLVFTHSLILRSFRAYPSLQSRDEDVNGTYIPTKAPYANIFAQLLYEENDALRTFLNTRQNTTE